MSNNEKKQGGNKDHQKKDVQLTNTTSQKKVTKNDFFLKQLGFLTLVILWGIAIVLKQQMNGMVKATVFVVLVILTIFGIYQLNKNIFGRKNNDL